MSSLLGVLPSCVLQMVEVVVKGVESLVIDVSGIELESELNAGVVLLPNGVNLKLDGVLLSVVVLVDPLD